jgi:hypothetical protein
MKKHEQGFIALFFILSISFTFVAWISLASERVFEYLRIKKDFDQSKVVLYDHMLCADVFVRTMIASDYNMTFVDNSFDFKRHAFFYDTGMCHISDIQVVQKNEGMDKILFISGDFAFEYRFENGFVNHILSFKLP